MTRRLAAVLIGLALLARSGAAEPTGDATVALNFQDVDIPVLAKFVSEVTGRNFIIDDRVRGKVTVISPTRLTPDEAYLVFQSVLQVKGFTTVPAGGFTKIVPSREALAIGAGGDQVTTRVVPLEHADAATIVPVLQPLVSKDGVLTAHPATNRLVIVDTAGNVERLAALARDLDQPGAADAAETLALRHASADEIAKRLRDALAPEGTDGLKVVAEPRTNSLVLSGPPDEIARARTVARRLDVPPPPGSSTVHVYRLKNADSGSLVRVLAQLLGQPLPPEPERRPQGSSFARRAMDAGAAPVGYDGGMGEPPPTGTTVRAEPASTGSAASIPLQAPVRITADPATNALIVSAEPEDWRTLSGVIVELDVRRRQVMVEAIILEVTTDKLHSLGLEFQGAGQTGSTVGFGQLDLGVLGSAGPAPTSLPGLILAAASNHLVKLPSGEEVPAYTLLLTAIERESDVNVLSAPNVVTTDNEEAEIVVGRNVPFVASRATSSSNLSNLFTTIVRYDVGITLRMTPQIIADDFVRLTLFEEVSDIDPAATDVGDPEVLGPTTTVRSASTVVAARDGQTVVIGGLLADALRETERGVPFLSDVPVLGALFRRTDDRRLKTNLLVFLTPHVIASDTQMAARSVAERDKLPRRARDSAAVREHQWSPEESPR